MVNDIKKESNLIKQNPSDLILILLDRKIWGIKHLHSLKPPFHSGEVIIDIKFYLLNFILLCIKLHPLGSNKF